MSDFALTHPKRAARLAFERVNTSSRPTVMTLAEDISAATGKRIDIREIADLGRGGAAALWLELDDRHLILESAPTSQFHQNWVRTHEFGHIVYSHLGWAAPPVYAQQSAGGGAPNFIEAARTHRMNFRLPSEQAAEEFARFAHLSFRDAGGGTLNSDFSVVLS